MKNINKQFLKGMLLSCVLLISSYQETRAEEATPPHIYTVTNDMVNAVKNAPNAAAALDALCGQGGVIRGSGWSAGNTCKLQDFARVAVMACQGYGKGKDTFGSSKCAQNINKVLGARGINSAKIYIEDSIKQQYTNVTTFVCDTTPGYRDKLPAGLKLIAANFCAKPIAPARPTAKPPVQSSETVTSRPRANAISSRPLPPPIEPNVIIQSALRDLPPRDSMMIDNLFEGQNYLLGALEYLEKKDQQLALQGVPKVNSMRGEIEKKESVLIDNYEDTQTTLLEIKTAIELRKPIAPALYEEAKKLSVAIKKLSAELDETSAKRSRIGG